MGVVVICALLTLSFWGLYHAKQRRSDQEKEQRAKMKRLLNLLGFFFLCLSLVVSIKFAGIELGIALWLLLVPVPIVTGLFSSNFLKNRSSVYADMRK